MKNPDKTVRTMLLAALVGVGIWEVVILHSRRTELIGLRSAQSHAISQVSSRKLAVESIIERSKVSEKTSGEVATLRSGDVLPPRMDEQQERSRRAVEFNESEGILAVSARLAEFNNRRKYLSVFTALGLSEGQISGAMQLLNEFPVWGATEIGFKLSDARFTEAHRGKLAAIVGASAADAIINEAVRFEIDRNVTNRFIKIAAMGGRPLTFDQSRAVSDVLNQNRGSFIQAGGGKSGASDKAPDVSALEAVLSAEQLQQLRTILAKAY